MGDELDVKMGQLRDSLLKQFKNESDILKALIDSINDEIWFCDTEGNFVLANKAAMDTFGFNQLEGAYKSVRELLSNLEVYTSDREPRAKEDAPLLRSLRGEIINDEEEIVRHPDTGDKIYRRVSSAPFRDKVGQIRGAVTVVRDETRRKENVEQIKLLLREKEALLREIHHRIKNNLQTVSDLLDFQFAHIDDNQARKSIRESQNRIESIARIHKYLYESKRLQEIDFASYLRSLVNDLLSLYGMDERDISLDLEIENIELDADRAVSCGLIVNEIISNSLRHAFPEGKSGKIWVRLSKISDDMARLVVGDNGVGLRPGFDLQEAQTVGMQLIEVFINQLGGEVDIRTEMGTEFVVTFSL